ncbi:helix-turn-helix domain-containing protein [Tsuneonella sp. YG55]|uniref:Helix-turn-helix domain-containing protein n=1 Tax=Tsuneonella litorea TaxID=2976475 RepID=A0A9X2W1B6_9SPHN|nr:helix-turn-helix transcriptional regulator [Tsuneonella litorea]MCT2559235.1 helix-turn-helix domain-containing protein [Tsuneonella litorea]
MNAKQCKMARDGLGLTGRVLAEEAGVPYATLARFEAGANIRADTVEKLADTLAASGAQFVYGADRYGVTVPE